MQTNPLVSIVIPVYNMELYLGKCLQSVVNQTYQNIEILLVDDGSTDASPAICETSAAQDSRIRVFHQPNGGLSAARNTGIDAANGEYLTFIDSDDWVENNYVAALMELSQTHQVDIAVVGFIIEKQGKSRPEHVDKGICVWDMKTAYRKLCRDRELHNYACGKLFTRHLFRDIRFPVGQFYEDIAIMGSLLCQVPRIAVHHIPLYHYLIRPGSITQSGINPEHQWHRMQALHKQYTLGISIGVFKNYPPRFLRRCIRFIDKIILTGNAETSRTYLKKISPYLRLYTGRLPIGIGLKAWICKELILHHPEFYCRWIQRIKS